MKNDILREIIAHKRFEVDIRKKDCSLDQLRDNVSNVTYTPVSMKNALKQSQSGIIAEFKRKSPSKGWIKEEADVSVIVPGYEHAGATALSILTDEVFFGGSLKDLSAARPLVNIPILRKDFIINEYQLYQARIVGADAVLLIAAALKPEECNLLALKAHELGLEVLLEIHEESELVYVNEHIDMVGVNNRNLGSFHTDIRNSFRLADQLPHDTVLVSESGIKDAKTIVDLREKGYRGFLIGENFMKTDNPSLSLRSLISEI